MADPLSLVSAIVGLTAVGTKLFNQLYQFIESFRSAPSNVLSLARELEDLCSILTRLESTLNSGVRHEVLWLGLRDVLESCVKRFSQLEMLVKACGIRGGDGRFVRQWKKWRWTFQEKEVTALRIQLEAHKATLNITLLLATHSETTSVKDTADRIESAVQVVLERLEKIQDGKNSIASYASGIGRYFQESVLSLGCLSSVDGSEEQADPTLVSEEVNLLQSECNRNRLLERSQISVETKQPLDVVQTSRSVAQELVGEATQVSSERGPLPQQGSQLTWTETRPLQRMPSQEGDESYLADLGIQTSTRRLVQSPAAQKEGKGEEEEEGERKRETQSLEYGGGEGQIMEEVIRAWNRVICSLKEEEERQSSGKGSQPPGKEEKKEEEEGEEEEGKGQELESQLSEDDCQLGENERGEEKGVLLQFLSNDGDSRPQMQLVKISVGNCQLPEEGIQSLEKPIESSEREYGQILINRGVNALYKLGDSKLQLLDEGIKFSDGVAQTLREDSLLLRKESGEEGEEEDKVQHRVGHRSEKVAGMWSFWCGQDAPVSNFPGTCGEGQLVGQLERSMRLKVELQLPYGQTISQSKEKEAVKLKGSSIEGIEWERVRNHLPEKWRDGREAEGRKRTATKRKYTAEKGVGQGGPRNSYTISNKTGDIVITSEGWGISMMLPKTYTCKNALEKQNTQYMRDLGYFIVQKILTKGEQEYMYLWACTKQIGCYIRETKDTTNQVPTVYRHPDKYVKYIKLAGQELPIAPPITIEVFLDGSKRPKVGVIKWTDLSPPKSSMDISNCFRTPIPERSVVF